MVSATSAASVTVRITLSAGNQSNSYALQCLVRESLIDWMQRESLIDWMQCEAPYVLPRARVEIEQVEVTHDPEPEQVAQMAEEIVQPVRQNKAFAYSALHRKGTSATVFILHGTC